MCDTARSAISKWNCLHDFRLFAKMGINEPTSLRITIGEMPAPWTTCSNSMQGTLGNVLWIHLNACFGNWHTTAMKHLHFRFRGMLLLCRVIRLDASLYANQAGMAFMSHWAFLPSTAWAPVSEQPSQPQFVSGFGGSGTTYKRLQNAWTCFVLILTTQSLSIVHVDPWFSMRDYRIPGLLV